MMDRPAGRRQLDLLVRPAYAAMAERRTGALSPKVRAPAKLRPAA
jgi:hypothetical protein